MEQLSLFQSATQIKPGDEVIVNWNECDLDYIKKSLPQLLTTGIVTREKLNSFTLKFGDHTVNLIDASMINRIN